MANAQAQFQPKAFGEYYLLERIAVGGMAEIFKAKTYGVGGFEKLLAIKRILPHHAQNQEFISMLIDEAKIAVALNHVNIVQVYDLGKIEGDYFIAMEYVEGRDLRSLIRRCKKLNIPISIENAVFIILEICKGLDYAHRKTDRSGKTLGIVHRDISPQNILISFEGEVKIVDFGIAKAANKITETDSGILKGKFSYMSPEQAAGNPLDQRTDIYSTAIIMYELLVGEKLFSGQNHLEILDRIKKFHIDPPFLPADVPSELEYILAHALANSREERYPFASDFQVELNKFLYSSSLDFTARNLAQLMHQLFHKEYEEERNRERVDFQVDESTRSMMLKGQSQSLVSKTDYSLESSEEITHTSKHAIPARNRTIIKKFRRVLGSDGEETQPSFRVKPGRKGRPGSPLAVPVSNPAPPPGVEITEKIPLQGQEGGVRAEIRQLEREESTSSYASLAQAFNAQLAGFAQGFRALPGWTKVKILLLFFGSLICLIAVSYWLTRQEPAPSMGVESPAAGTAAPVAVPVTTSTPAVLVEKSPTLDLTSEPPEVQVFMNGELVGTTPLHRFPLALGREVKVTLQKEGYEPVSFPVKLEEPLEMHKILEVAHRVLQVESQPSGAQVFLNGKLRGSTPFEAEHLQAGAEYLVVVRSPGFRDGVRKVRMDTQEPKKITLQLQDLSSKMGSVMVESEPKGASLKLNGKIIGQKTPAVLENLLVDRKYSLKVELPYHEPVVYRDFQVNAEQAIRLHAKLKRLTGRVTFKSYPANARIFINDRPEGQTPNTVVLECGLDYVVELRKGGYKNLMRRIKMETTESQILDLTLEPQL